MRDPDQMGLPTPFIFIHVIEPDQRDREVIAPCGTILNVQHQCDGPGGVIGIIVSTIHPQLLSTRFTTPYASIEHRLHHSRYKPSTFGCDTAFAAVASSGSNLPISVLSRHPLI
jgi:hypothetical protein